MKPSKIVGKREGERDKRVIEGNEYDQSIYAYMEHQ
jgi:hypothetical protein